MGNYEMIKILEGIFYKHLKASQAIKSIQLIRL